MPNRMICGKAKTVPEARLFLLSGFQDRIKPIPELINGFIPIDVVDTFDAWVIPVAHVVVRASIAWPSQGNV